MTADRLSPANRALALSSYEKAWVISGANTYLNTMTSSEIEKALEVDALAAAKEIIALSPEFLFVLFLLVRPHRRVTAV